MEQQQQQQLTHYVVYVRGHYSTHRKEKKEAIEFAEYLVGLGADHVCVSKEHKKIIWIDGKVIEDNVE